MMMGLGRLLTMRLPPPPPSPTTAGVMGVVERIEVSFNVYVFSSIFSIDYFGYFIEGLLSLGSKFWLRDSIS